MFNLADVQQALSTQGLDGWLLYDFRGNNILARRILDLDARPAGSRRFAYYVPRSGEPRKLVHRIESAALAHLPGETRVYLKWQEWDAGLSWLLAGGKRVALEYAPLNAIPYLSRVDAGTVEQVRQRGVEPVCSGNLVQLFEATWDDDQWMMHRAAEAITTAAFDLAWRLIAERASLGLSIRESEVQQAILDHFERHEATTYSPPIVAVGPHSGDPHFETQIGPDDTPIKPGDFVLIDLWAKLKRPRAVYSDLTRVGFVGTQVPPRFTEPFAVVTAARDAAIALVTDRFAAGQPLHGWEVDRATRQVIADAGLGAAFVHRTGHSIGQEVHGNGANLDDLETHDERLILRRTCFSVEPGVYFDDFGMRSEVNVFVDAAGTVHVTGGLQREVLTVLA